MNTIKPIITLILLVAVGAVAYFVMPKNNDMPGTIAAQHLNADVYPLFPGIKWGSEMTGTDTYFKITGYKVDSSVMTEKDIPTTLSPFQTYYDEKMKKAGWTMDINMAADGPASSSWGYTKGNEVAMFSYHFESLDPKPDEIFSCPCEGTFSIMTGTRDQ